MLTCPPHPQTGPFKKRVLRVNLTLDPKPGRAPAYATEMVALAAGGAMMAATRQEEPRMGAQFESITRRKFLAACGAAGLGMAAGPRLGVVRHLRVLASAGGRKFSRDSFSRDSKRSAFSNGHTRTASRRG